MGSDFLASADRELSFLIWRAEVHQLSIGEVDQALTMLRTKLLNSRSEQSDASAVLDGFFESHENKIRELKKRSRHNPPAGLIWSV